MASEMQHPAKGTPGPSAFDRHDHRLCIEAALDAAEDRCAQDGLRFTPVRRKVLEILLEEHRALGAYAMLERLGRAGFGSQPVVAYRALDFLVEHRFVHRIERLNAFVACAHPGESHSPAFMICRVCNAVAETQSEPSDSTLGAAAQTTGFVIERTMVEAVGVCPNCVEKADA